MIHLRKKSISEQSGEPVYTREATRTSLPLIDMPDEGILPETAYNIINDQLILDGSSRLNLGTFLTSWVEPEAEKLLVDTYDKNMINKDEYPQTTEFELGCVNMLARLWNAPDHTNTIGTSTLGSSEACMLGGIALKKRWMERRKNEGKPYDKPNIIMSAAVQICWKKFCKYWDIEAREVPLEEGRYVLSPEQAIKLCDENTIGIVGIMGTTFTGEYEPIEELNDALEKLNKETGWDIGIHVDAANGGFIAPFLHKKIVWDFRLPLVRSINVSGHKFGLVPPGVGWILWRDKEYLPEDLIFYVDYLSGEIPTFGINFSRPGSQIVIQYYNMLRFGKNGFTKIHKTSQEIAEYLASQIEELGPFEIVSRGHEIPMVTYKIKEKANVDFNLYDLVDRLHMNGWLMPAYPLPKNCQDTTIARVVVRNGFSKQMADNLLSDIKEALEHFTAHGKPVSSKPMKLFKHT